MALSVGDQAPDFTLPSETGEPLTLSKLYAQRTVVLYFYPKDNTPGCTVEACTFRDQYETFVEAGAEVVGVSSDSVASHERFASKHKLPMRLVADEGGKVRALYGVKATLGLLPGRVTFVIDRQGKIRHTFSSQVQVNRHVAEALQAVRELEGGRPAASATPS
jgi:peroxiredoxin Q/BCP